MSSRKRSRTDVAATKLSSHQHPALLPFPDHTTESPRGTPFTVVVWNEIGVVLFGRIMDLVRNCLVNILINFNTSEKRNFTEEIRQLGEDLHVAWRARFGCTTAVDLSTYETTVSDGIDHLCFQIEQLTKAYDDNLSVCKQFMRLMEDYGFLEEDGGCLGSCLAAIKFSAYGNGYAYSERSSLPFPIPKLDADKPRSGDGDHAGLATTRVGYSVNLQESPSLDPAINTSIILIEPRKRRPPLDEYRIFSHPRKTTTHGVEDLIVDEELYIRSLRVLSHHLDAFGSLQGVSPFVRFTVYNMCSKLPSVFDSLVGLPSTCESFSKQIQHLRALVEEKKMSFTATWRSLREGAQRIGWYSVSAQWRDQALFALHDAEEADWYSIADTLLRGGMSNFPNYSQCDTITNFMMEVVKRPLNSSMSCAIGIIQMILIPLLQGGSIDNFASTKTASSELIHFDQTSRRVYNAACSVMGHEFPFPLEKLRDSTESVGEGLTVVVPSMMIPLQRILELLELCSTVLLSANGAEQFIQLFLNAEWETEEDILQFLISYEPTNLHLVSLVAIPKVRQELIGSIDGMLSDSTFSLAVSAKHVFTCVPLPTADIQEKKYWYWKVLTKCLEDVDRHDDLYFLHASNNSDLLSKNRTSHPFFESCIERASRVWPQEMAQLILEEKKYRLQG